MCGILFSTDPSVTAEQFNGALARLNHRGPDARGYEVHAGYHMGHTRLKILDLDNRSNQPLSSSDGRYVILFNGEIYNFRDLARRQGLRNLRTTSDTEVVVELYAQHGHKMLEWLEGMFAFVIVDIQTKRVFVARDRLGVKPLYWMSTPTGAITVSSEVAPMLALGGGKSLDEIGVRQYLKLRTFFNNRTLYRDISMFPAAHYMLDERRVRYWSLPLGPRQPPNDEELRQLVVDSVRDRLISDVPVGSFLSGGLDSSIIAAVSKTPHTWTVGFPDHNEFSWARLASEHIGSTHHEVVIAEDEFIPLAESLVRIRKEPLSVPNEVLLYKMTQAVKPTNTVILCGEGADELFFGYDRIFRWADQQQEFDLRTFATLYSYGSHDDDEIVEDAIGPFLDAGKPIDIVAHFFQVAHLHGLLRRVDFATMMCSVEARVPFVDAHALVERMAGVPFSYRCADGRVKSPLKRIFASLLPPEVIDREKVGFPVPLERFKFAQGAGTGSMSDWLGFNLRTLLGADAESIVGDLHIQSRT